MLSQSAPSSFFANVAPVGTTPTLNLPGKRSPYRPRDGAIQENTKCGGKSDWDDEDEEIKSLSSNTNDEKNVNSNGAGVSSGRRNLSTPSPKPKRSFTSTPTRTPPMRNGAIPPIPYSSLESDHGGVAASISSNVPMNMSARNTTPGSRKRGTDSPIVISGTPSMSTDVGSAVHPKCVRTSSKESSGSSGVGSGGAAAQLKINVEEASGQKKRARYLAAGRSSASAGYADRYQYAAEFHLSPNGAFEDCSVHSGSSASYYSNNHQ